MQIRKCGPPYSCQRAGLPLKWIQRKRRWPREARCKDRLCRGLPAFVCRPVPVPPCVHPGGGRCNLYGVIRRRCGVGGGGGAALQCPGGGSGTGGGGVLPLQHPTAPAGKHAGTALRDHWDGTGALHGRGRGFLFRLRYGGCLFSSGPGPDAPVLWQWRDLDHGSAPSGGRTGDISAPSAAGG